MTDKNWKDIVANEDAYVATDNTDHHLYRDAEEFPWEHVHNVKLGGTWRFNTPVNLCFEAKVGKITFSWFVDIEKEDSNGKGTLRIDNENLLAYAMKLPNDHMRKLMYKALEDIAKHVDKQAKEYLEYTMRLAGDAATIKLISQQISA